ncbi:MAG: ribonuclease HIII [Clostridia bacterium]|nr:ribonuclease HIII [Clostridia bacterium]
MNQTVSIKVTLDKLKEMQKFYSEYLVINNGEYVAFQANVNSVVVTGWLSKKEMQKVTFVGFNALEEAKIWDKDAKLLESKSKPKEQWLFTGDQIGSDEVGVGDFVAPMIVVAALVKESDIPTLIKLGIRDSKKITDKDILEIGPKAVKAFKFSKLTIPNWKYNEMYEKGENLNSLKAKMHNRALLNMHREYPEIANIFVDQFVEEKTYYKYLNDANEEQVKGILFKTKGESYFPCVALASVIARYAFLMEMKSLEEKYQMKFPLGASQKVTEFAQKFVDKFGIDEFNKIAKRNFANYKEIIK